MLFGVHDLQSKRIQMVQKGTSFPPTKRFSVHAYDNTPTWMSGSSGPNHFVNRFPPSATDLTVWPLLEEQAVPGQHVPKNGVRF